jgi:predicted RNase H-like HicB family nuclease
MRMDFWPYPVGVEGVVVGQGESADEAIADARSALSFHIECFGREVLDRDLGEVDAYVVIGEVPEPA